MLWRTSVLLAVWMVSVPATARAGSFFEDGSFAFDPTAAVALDFETDQIPPSADPEKAPSVRASSTSALSGQWVIEVEPFQDADFVVKLPAQQNTYRVSMWVRGDGVGFAVVSHGATWRAQEVASLVPTGRITSDGWVELANEGLRVDGVRSSISVGAFCPGGCELDAIEMVVDGVIDGEPNPKCKGAADANACGIGQVCYWSECRNVNGWVPPIPADREQVTSYLQNRLSFLFGPYIERTLDMPAAMLAIEQMSNAADPWSYWNAFTLAVRRLHDGHTSTGGLAGYVLTNPKPLNVCFLEGVADLSHTTEPSDPLYRDVIVSHVGALQSLGLKAGDRLVRVDGQHPIAWSRSLITHYWSQPAVSNHDTFAEHASRLRSSISRFANEIEVIRCDSQTISCGPVEKISIDALPSLDPEATFDAVICDNRPLRHVPGAPESHGAGYADVFAGLLDESNPSEKIHGVEWESLMTTNGVDGIGGPLNAAIKALKDEGATAVIFDHRTGTGGTMAGPAIIWDFAVPWHPVSFYQPRHRAEDEQPSLAEGLVIWNAALGNGWVDYAGGATPTTIPVALLLTQDVSASDWLPLGMKGAADNVRLFGPYQTNGGFSTRFQFGYHMGLTFVLATGDTFIADGTTHNGRGVHPDVVVSPLQSDLLVGQDTVFNAALVWVRQELGQ